MKTVSGMMNKNKFEYTIEYVDVMEFYRSIIKIYKENKINPGSYFLLLKKSITASTEQEAEEDSIKFVRNFINIYTTGLTNNECNHEYIPMFTSYCCKHCGKEK